MLKGITRLAAAVLMAAAATAGAADKIMIGSSLPMTGINALFGAVKRDGINAYLNRVNKAGGVGGRQLELVVLDDGYVPARMVANVREIANTDAVALLGLLGVPTIAATVPVISELRIPAVGLTTGTSVVRAPYNRYLFPVRSSYADEARLITDNLNALGLKKVVIVQQDLPFGKAVAELFASALEKQGMQRASLHVMDVDGKNAASIAGQIKAEEAGAVFFAGLSNAAIPLVKAFRQNNVAAAFYSFSPVDATTLVKELGSSARGVGITQVMPIPQGVGTPVVREYLEALKELGNANPHFYGLEAFVEAKVLVEGLRRAGKDVTRDSLVRALESMRDFDLGGVAVTYDSQYHRGSQFVELTVVSASGALVR